MGRRGSWTERGAGMANRAPRIASLEGFQILRRKTSQHACIHVPAHAHTDPDTTRRVHLGLTTSLFSAQQSGAPGRISVRRFRFSRKTINLRKMDSTVQNITVF